MAQAAHLPSSEDDVSHDFAGEDFSIFVSAEEVAHVEAALTAGETDLATVMGLEKHELEALYSQGMDQLRTGMLQQALATFLKLVRLKPAEGRFVRAIGLVFHYRRMFGWARAIYGQAMVIDAGDVVTLCLRAECTLLVLGKPEAVKELEAVTAMKARNRFDTPYLERAQALLNKLRVYREGT